MQKLPQKVQSAVEYLKSQMGDRGAVFLFGSRARATKRSGGDYDIAVVPVPGTTWEDVCAWRSCASDLAWPYKVDIVDLTRAPRDFLEAIKNELIPLHGELDKERLYGQEA